MPTLIIILFCLSGLAFVLHLNQCKTKLATFKRLMGVALFLWVAYPWAIEQSYLSFKAYIGNADLMGYFLLLQLIESSIGLWLAFKLTRQLPGSEPSKLVAVVRSLPGISLLPALFFVLSTVFLQLPGYDFGTIVLITAITLPLSLGVLAYAFKKAGFNQHLDLKYALHLAQIFLTLVLSVGLLALPTSNAPSGLHLEPLLFIAGGTCALTLAGTMWYRLQIKLIQLKINKYK